jgi:hypothetical protein
MPKSECERERERGYIIVYKIHRKACRQACVCICIREE